MVQPEPCHQHRSSPESLDGQQRYLQQLESVEQLQPEPRKLGAGEQDKKLD